MRTWILTSAAALALLFVGETASNAQVIVSGGIGGPGYYAPAYAPAAYAAPGVVVATPGLSVGIGGYPYYGGGVYRPYYGGYRGGYWGGRGFYRGGYGYGGRWRR